MGRMILAIVVALIVAVAIMMVIEMGNSMIVMPPSQEIMNDRAALCDYMSRGPATAYIVVLIGYVLASFAAGFIVTKMSRRESPGMTLPIIVAALLELGMIANVVMLPCQPVWFIAIGLIIFIPITLVGHRFAAGRF
jgi:hypothetical protein